LWWGSVVVLMACVVGVCRGADAFCCGGVSWC
jgi:hypothetical protein